MTTRIVVVDDQALVRTGFAMIIGAEPDLEVVGEAADGLEALTVVAATRPDVWNHKPEEFADSSFIAELDVRVPI